MGLCLLEPGRPVLDQLTLQRSVVQPKLNGHRMPTWMRIERGRNGGAHLAPHRSLQVTCAIGGAVPDLTEMSARRIAQRHVRATNAKAWPIGQRDELSLKAPGRSPRARAGRTRPPGPHG